MKPVFYDFFEYGKTDGAVWDDGAATIARHGAGDLIVSSGQLVACDPLTMIEPGTFERTVEPGTYPVFLDVVVYNNNADQRVACAMIEFKGGPVHHWEMALVPGQDAGKLSDGEFFGYGVDSGTGCFMDQDAASALNDLMDEEDEYYEVLIADMDKTYVDTWSWMNRQMDETTGANLIAFSSGVGDGAYPSYFGFDADNEVVCLVTDFLLFIHDDEEAVV